MWTSRHRRPGPALANAHPHRPAHRPAGGGRWRRAAKVWAVVAGLAVVLVGCNRTPERSTEAFCGQVGSVQGLDQVLAGTDAAQAARQVEQLRALDQVAPADIEPSVAQLVGVADELAHALGTTPDPEVAADAVFRRHQSDVAAITDAGAMVERYALDRCGVRLNPTGTAPLATSPVTTGSSTTTTLR
jgi:hypothetical protein